MSSVRFTLLGRGLTAVVAALGVSTAVQSCAFPEHTFNDESFYGKGDGARPGHGGETPDSSLGSGGFGGLSNGTGGGEIGKSGGLNADASVGGTTSTGKGEGGLPPPLTIDGGIDGALLDGATRDAEPPCPSGFSRCSGVCVDLLSDPAHCGDCATSCTGTDVCTENGCAPPCGPGLTLCTPSGSSTKVCVDTSLDENNCSRCNAPCPGGFVCEDSKCVVDCGAQLRCGTQCVDPQTDDQHCGDCTNNCKSLGQVCSGGACQASCSLPFVACGASCINPATDDQHCGGCAKPACGTGQACVAGACKTLVEDCSNGTDDDRDGKADCADPDCTSGFVCASTPAGWTGPIALWSGAKGAAPACSSSGGYPNSLLSANNGLVVPQYTCPACKCAPSAGTYCDNLTFVFDTSTDCTDKDPWQDVTLAPASTCSSVVDLCCAIPSARSMRLANPPSSYIHGGCTASQASPSFPATSWSGEALGCASSPGNGGGCAVGACMPKPKAPFGTQLCVFRAGVASCPVEYPVAKPQFYQSVTEGRSCSQCSCGSGYCGGDLSISNDKFCSVSTVKVNVQPGNTCTTIAADTSQSGNADTRTYKFTNAGPVCGTATSTLQGAPTPDSPMTVCCQSP